MKTAKADPVRRHAILALHAVVCEGRSLSAPSDAAELEPQALARYRALVFTAVRWRHRLDAVIDQLIQKPLRRRDLRVRSVVLLALSELEYLEGAPHAVVDSAVALTSALGHAQLRGLVNAVLRRFLRERDSLLSTADRSPAVRASLPDWLYTLLRNDWPAEIQQIAVAGNVRGPMTLRVAERVGRDAYRERLSAVDLTCELGPGTTDLVLDQPVAVSRLPGFDNGDCSVQDSAAQFAALLLRPRAGERVLDACAAPGGKTGHLLECGADATGLTALDADASRLARVSETLERLQFDGVTVLAADAADTAQWWDGEGYDAVLVDAPCSGLGVLRRHPDIKSLRRASDLDALAEKQTAMLDALWAVLKPGGRLLYATCSIARQENERQVANFLARTADAVEVAVELPVGRAVSVGWQILPGEMACDGFYYALLHRLTGSAHT